LESALDAGSSESHLLDGIFREQDFSQAAAMQHDRSPDVLEERVSEDQLVKAEREADAVRMRDLARTERKLQNIQEETNNEMQIAERFPKDNSKNSRTTSKIGSCSPIQLHSASQPCASDEMFSTEFQCCFMCMRKEYCTNPK
jgi:hypothetical protein